MKRLTTAEFRTKFEENITSNVFLVDTITKELNISGQDITSKDNLFIKDEIGNYKSVLLQSIWNTMLVMYDGTPSSVWFVQDGNDPHIDYLSRERYQLPLGKLTDDQLANELYLFGDGTRQVTINDLIAGKTPIVYLTAGKERIRWLSRKVQELEAKLGK